MLKIVFFVQIKSRRRFDQFSVDVSATTAASSCGCGVDGSEYASSGHVSTHGDDQFRSHIGPQCDRLELVPSPSSLEQIVQTNGCVESKRRERPPRRQFSSSGSGNVKWLQASHRRDKHIQPNDESSDRTSDCSNRNAYRCRPTTAAAAIATTKRNLLCHYGANRLRSSHNHNRARSSSSASSNSSPTSATSKATSFASRHRAARVQLHFLQLTSTSLFFHFIIIV